MPNLETYTLQKICGLFDEAIRTIPGYDKYDPTYQPKALIHYEKSKDNYAIYVNDCMLHQKGERNKSKKIEHLIQEKTGHHPRKDAVACSIILTLPREYEGDEHLFFQAAFTALLIACGIKKEDVLYAVVHKDETQPHLHFAFLPISYCIDYDVKKELWLQEKAIAQENGTKVPARPSYLKGECNRKIAPEEKAIGYNCGRFGKGFLHTLNKTLETRMAEQGIECRISNKEGGKFSPKQMLHEQRAESVRLYEENESYKKEINKLKSSRSTLQEEFDTAYQFMQQQLYSLKEETMLAKEETGKAKKELDNLQNQLAKKEIELEEKEIQLSSIKEIIQALKAELDTLIKKAATFIPNLIQTFIEKWKEAKSIVQRTKINEDAEKEAKEGITALAKPLKTLEEKAASLLKEEVVSGIKMLTFEPSPKKIDFAKKQIAKIAKYQNKPEVITDDALMELALQDWFNKKKYKKIIENMSELEASLYMENAIRAARAIEYALEKEKEELGTEPEL